MKIKKDKYLGARGGTAKIINVVCVKCGEKLFSYQKGGPGWLKRCYLNRILRDTKQEQIKIDVVDLDKMENLVCGCGEVIGMPMKHKDGRLAFRLIRGKFLRGLAK